MRIMITVAKTREQVLRCQALIAEVYNRDYEVVFSDDHYDLAAKVEPWPHRYIMGVVDDELVCAAGLYVRSTYVERFGDIRDEDIERVVAEAGAAGAYANAKRREITKISVHRGFRGHGLARMILGAAHSRHFLEIDADGPILPIFCAKRSIVRSIHNAVGLRTRVVKPFPIYKVHELYASPADPMDSIVIIPTLDIPPRWYDLPIPGEYDVASFGGPR